MTNNSNPLQIICFSIFGLFVSTSVFIVEQNLTKPDFKHFILIFFIRKLNIFWIYLLSSSKTLGHPFQCDGPDFQRINIYDSTKKSLPWIQSLISKKLNLIIKRLWDIFLINLFHANLGQHKFRPNSWYMEMNFTQNTWCWQFFYKYSICPNYFLVHTLTFDIHIKWLSTLFQPWEIISKLWWEKYHLIPTMRNQLIKLDEIKCHFFRL